jgi:hypothetical protein
MTEKRSKSDQTFDFNTMTAVIYCMMKDNVVLGNRHYQVMSALSGTRTASSFEHDFRNAKRQAKELFDKGDAFDLKIKDNARTKKPNDGASPATKQKGKRGEFHATSSNTQVSNNDIGRESKNAQSAGKTKDTDDCGDLNEDFGSKKVKVEKEDELDSFA